MVANPAIWRSLEKPMGLYCYSRSHRKLNRSGSFRQVEAVVSGNVSGRRSGQAGQAVVEYILMVIIACGIAALVVRLMVSQSADSPGFVISKWNDLVTAISSDATDEAK